MKTLLVICPTVRDLRELKLLQNKYRFIFFQLSEHDIIRVGSEINDGMYTIFDLFKLITKRYQGQKVDGVLYSYDYPGTAFAAVIAREFGLLGPEVESVLRSQHKYYARIDQQQYVPEAVPNFVLVDPREAIEKQDLLPYPFFIKPVKSSFSIGARPIRNKQELVRVLADLRKLLSKQELFNQLLAGYTNSNLDANGLIAETHLEGIQTTLEGWVCRGNVQFAGLVDSVMFPGTISFKRFEYPSALSETVQERMKDIACRYIKGIGLDNLFFNIEFMYDPATDGLYIIEMNPRMVSQFADLYEKVHGINTYQLLIDLVLNQEPVFEKNRGGQYACAASCVLRIFEDQLVKKVPSPKVINKLSKEFPQARFELCAAQGKKLSQVRQDGYSFRYGLVHLGAQGHQQLLKNFEQCKKMLDFSFEPV